MLRIDAYGQSTTQCNLIFRYDATYGATSFANSSIWGWLPGAGQLLRFYNAQSTVALEISATSNTTTIHGTFVNSSDRRLKEGIEQADYVECQRVFDNVEVQTYKRNDTETSQHRLGFIAQDVQAALPTKWQNIVRPFLFEHEDKSREEMLGIDYARLTCVLWGVLKNQQATIVNLDARVAALEMR